MATFTVTPGSDGVTIQLVGVGEEKGALLDSFDACAHGTCGCPTNEYEKLSSVEVGSDGDAITIDLQTRPGEIVDPARISDCLRYTTAAARAGND